MKALVAIDYQNYIGNHSDSDVANSMKDMIKYAEAHNFKIIHESYPYSSYDFESLSDVDSIYIMGSTGEDDVDKYLKRLEKERIRGTINPDYVFMVAMAIDYDIEDNCLMDDWMEECNVLMPFFITEEV